MSVHSRALRAILAIALLLPGLIVPTPRSAAARDPAIWSEFFGIVGRDPWYEFNSDPERYPVDVNRTFLETMMAEMARMGARWVRIEFHAEYDQPTGPGWIDWNTHDWYLFDLAPRYGMRVLGVLGSGILADLDPTYAFSRINDTPDREGRNRYTRAFVTRTAEIVGRYGPVLAAVELLNEPNANELLWEETNQQVHAVRPEIYGRLAVDVYETIQRTSPSTRLVAGSVLFDRHADGDRHLAWLRAVYGSPAVREFRARTGRYPWDALSLHPYFLPDAASVLAAVRELRSVQLEYGDTSPIWITEVGMPAEPAGWSASGVLAPTPSELEQAEFLRQVYTLLWERAPEVERVFWFKFEDFGTSHGYANWGLVRLLDSNKIYAREAIPWPRKPAFLVYQQLARPEAVPTTRVAPPADPAVRYFPETGHTLSGPFRRYWEQNGGLAAFGYPLTEAFWSGGRLVQFFERARFEYWPEFRGTTNEVQLAHLGRWALGSRSFAPQPPPEKPQPGERYFPETGYVVRDPFLRYWEQNGGLARFGLPISPEFREVNPSDGKEYMVQYFERARFELHPEAAGTPYEVQLGLLGAQALQTLGWYR
ncbi:MAG: glycoside hydrolase family protein [Thermomicrobium sp.]|nr:glycoside hydrolase family protein [Thermomicrobium sp.]